MSPFASIIIGEAPLPPVFLPDLLLKFDEKFWLIVIRKTVRRCIRWNWRGKELIASFVNDILHKLLRDDEFLICQVP